MPSPGSHFGGGPVVESPPPPPLLEPRPVVVPSAVVPPPDEPVEPGSTPPVVVSVVVAVGSTVVDEVAVVGSTVVLVTGPEEVDCVAEPEPLSVVVGVSPPLLVTPGLVPPLEPPVDTPPLAVASVAVVESPQPASARPRVTATSRPLFSIQGRFDIRPLCGRPRRRTQRSARIHPVTQVNYPTARS
jgi:hypothetical protein